MMMVVKAQRGRRNERADEERKEDDESVARVVLQNEEHDAGDNEKLNFQG